MTGRFCKAACSTVIVALLGVGLSGLPSASASPITPGAGWELTANSFPTNLPPGGSGAIVVNVLNVGAASSNGVVTVTDTLPPGVTATEAGELESLKGFGNGIAEIGHALWDCTISATHSVVTCTNDPENMPHLAGGGGNPGHNLDKNITEEGPYLDPQLAIAVKLTGTETSETNRVTIAGGGAQTSASTTDPITVSSKQGSFGFAGWDVWFSNPDGTLDTQAGSHPYEATFTYDLANFFHVSDSTGVGYGPVGGESRNLEVKLPPGLVGDPNAVPTCTRQELDAQRCPDASQVGIITVTLVGGFLFRFKVFNMIPPAGVPDEIGFTLEGIETRLDTSVRTGGDYGLTTHVNNVAEREVISSVLTLWGVPGDPSHDIWRTTKLGGCSQEDVEKRLCPSPGSPVLRPFLTLPTSCVDPQTFSIWGNVWGHPEITAEKSIETHDSSGTPTGFTGCERLSFAPTISTAPDTSESDTPAGLTVEVKPSTGGLLDPEGIGTTDIQNTTVTLPEGVVINPGQAAGLRSCQSSQDSVGTEQPAACPAASKVGTVSIETPLLTDKLEGNVYVLQSNPPNLKLLVAASADGVNLKLVGDVHLDEQTGRLTTTFEGTPALPFADFKLSFSGGGQAALVTPATCGTYTTTSDFNPWSSPFVADAFPTAAFAITSGPNGSPCPSTPLPFSPAMIAGSTTDQAGGYTNFSLLLQRADAQQRISDLQFKTPEGLLGMISRVPLCQEPQAAQGTCSSASQIGHTVVAAGPGPYPLVVPQPGQPPAPIYLTGPYKGAPYGLSIVVPLVVGPFTLPTQIVRGRIEVDPHTARLTVTTDPLPMIIAGVPADLRTINAVIDRPGFMFNPTNCSPQAFSGTATSTEGATAPLESHFQMGSCRSLTFKPNFKVSTSGKTSRKRGASLDAKVLYPNIPPGDNQASSQSNIANVKVNLPRQLPSRLTTLQKACTVATFEANPANCPAASLVGHATAVTPVLPVPLTGPAYFVSHGGEAFPSLIVVLQGYGVTVDLVGSTFIDSKTNITSSTFKQVPDVPIASFELTLPQGPFSALAANGNLCKAKLKMPTLFTAQDGAVVKQSTPITVTGCAHAKKKAKGKKAGAHRKSHKRKR
jgi:hypothetical protein